jgi:hypothetical protein
MVEEGRCIGVYCGISFLLGFIKLNMLINTKLLILCIRVNQYVLLVFFTQCNENKLCHTEGFKLHYNDNILS